VDVLTALLWAFHNSRRGCCFPSYEAIAVEAEGARSTGAEALKGAGVGGRADLAAPHRGSRCASSACSADGRAAGGSSGPPTRTSSAIRTDRRRAFPLASPEIGEEHEIKIILSMYW
jgi:hypothetical protein